MRADGRYPIGTEFDPDFIPANPLVPKSRGEDAPRPDRELDTYKGREPRFGWDKKTRTLRVNFYSAPIDWGEVKHLLAEFTSIHGAIAKAVFYICQDTWQEQMFEFERHKFFRDPSEEVQRSLQFAVTRRFKVSGWTEETQLV